MQKLAIVMLVILLAACGKAPSMPTPEKGKTISSLTGKTNSEIIALKYNNEIDIKCQLRVQKGDKVDLGENPTDEFTWRMPGEELVIRFLNYKAEKKDLVIVVKLTSPLRFQENFTYLNERKQEFYLQYSPIISIGFRRARKTILNNGSIHEGASFKDVDIYENIPVRLFTMTSKSNDEVITEDVRCTLVTKISPAYADQWVRIK